MQNMQLLLTLFVLSLTTGSILGNAVEDAFNKYELVPDVLTKAPKQLLKVSYDSGVEANIGKELTPTQVKNQPVLEWQTEADSYYTIILTDPDAPSRKAPTKREFKHWLVVNVPGNDISSGDVLAAYIGSGPPQGTDLHRYTFLVYKQPGKLDVSQETRVANNSVQDRPKFAAAKFAEKYELGEPIAGNFYVAQFDDYVPILHKQIFGK